MSAFITLLGTMRGVFGFGCWVAPHFARKHFDLAGSALTTDTLMTRCFGARDFVLGAGVLISHKDISLRTMLILGIIVDGYAILCCASLIFVSRSRLDVAASCIAYSQGDFTNLAFLSTGVAASIFIGLGILGLQSLPANKGRSE